MSLLLVMHRATARPAVRGGAMQLGSDPCIGGKQEFSGRGTCWSGYDIDQVRNRLQEQFDAQWGAMDPVSIGRTVGETASFYIATNCTPESPCTESALSQNAATVKRILEGSRLLTDVVVEYSTQDGCVHASQAPSNLPAGAQTFEVGGATWICEPNRGCYVSTQSINHAVHASPTAPDKPSDDWMAKIEAELKNLGGIDWTKPLLFGMSGAAIAAIAVVVLIAKK